MKQPPERAAVFVGDQWLPVFVCNLIFSFSFREKGKRTAFSFCFSKKKTPGKRKKRPGKPFGWFPRTLSIDQSLALDLRRMEVGAFTIDFVGADVLIGPQAFVLLCSCTERRCAERRDLSGGRDGRDGQLMAEIF